MLVARLVFLPLVFILSACAVVDTAATVTGAAVSVTATAVTVTGKAVGAGIDAATGDEAPPASESEEDRDEDEGTAQ
jgi:hypothetical protein